MRMGRLSGPPSATTTLGQRIRAARLAAALSQWQLADSIGANQYRVSQYELDRLLPRPATLAAIAAAVGVPVEQLTVEQLTAATADRPTRRAPPPSAPTTKRPAPASRARIR